MADLTGHTFGKYQLIERMGRGGMADVYRGFQPGLDRDVAIKVLHSHLAEDANFITRFKREAKKTADLRHSHIVQVFDFDAEGESYYMAMEYIEGGETLKELLQKLNAEGQLLPLETVLRVVAQVADALEYAHQKGMVHRDIKPANILMRDGMYPVLGDFGIARIVGASGLTASGAMVGTPAYMSPEQGRGEPADERADIYALGIVLYEMITGQPPYDADTPYGVILKHINDPIISPRTYNQAMPAKVEHVVLKCLAKDPNDRYQSASEMHRALTHALETIDDETTIDAPTQTVPVPDSVETVVSAGQDDGATMPAAVPAVEGSPAAARGRGKQRRAAREAGESKKRRRWLWIPAIVLVVAVLVGGYLVYSGAFDPQTQLEDEAWRLMGEGDFVGAISNFEEVYEINGDPYYLETAASLSVAIEDYDRSLAYYERLLDETNGDPHFLVGNGYVLWRMGRFEEAVEFGQRALDLAPDLVEAHYLLGIGLREIGLTGEAREHLSTLLDLEGWEYSEPYFNTRYGHELRFDLALVELAEGNPEKALSLIYESLEYDSWWLEPYLVRSEIFKSMGDLPAARENLLQALEIANSDYHDAVPFIEEALRALAE